MPVLRNAEGMNYAQIEHGLNELGEKVSGAVKINTFKLAYVEEQV